MRSEMEWPKESGAREARSDLDFKSNSGGTWVAQSVKYPTLDLGSSHDLKVHEY